jgi:AcrR family transcriptional regulator
MPRSTSKPDRSPTIPDRRTDGGLESDALIESARAVLERQGGDGITVHEVLSEAGLGTRAFYRHFASKEALVLAVFAVAAQQEADRLRQRMAGSGNAFEAVTAWINARLELAFDDEVAHTMRALSVEAEIASRQMPDQMELAFDCMLAPLVEQLQRGQRDGSFAVSDPSRDARALHDVIWGETLRQWSGFGVRGDRDTAKLRVLGFCLRAIGVAPDHIPMQP